MLLRQKFLELFRLWDSKGHICHLLNLSIGKAARSFKEIQIQGLMSQANQIN